MDKLTDTTKQTFVRFLDGDLSIEHFEQWLYQHSDKLEKALHAELHLELISFVYSQKGAFTILKDTKLTFINSKEFNFWRTKTLLTDIVETESAWY